MCETFKVSTSGYYDWVDRVPCAREKANEALTLQIHSAFTASDETYGMLRVRAQLRDEGIKASRKRVARLMRQNHWRRGQPQAQLLRDHPARPAPAPSPRPGQSPVCGHRHQPVVGG